MFDFLKGGKANVSLTVDRPARPYYLGETVQATVTVQGEKDVKIREGRVILLCQEKYEYRYETKSQDSQGNQQTEIDTSWNTNEQEVKRQVILPECTVRGGSTQTFTFAAPLPPNLPPTCEGGRIVEVNWQVKATLDRTLASDFEATAKILVFSSPPGMMARPGEYGHGNEPGEAEMAFSLPGKEWVGGDVLEGQLYVRPRKDLKVSQVRVALVRREYVPRDLGNEYLEEQKVVLDGNLELQAGQERTYPFTLHIPARTPPTCRTGNSSVTWTLQGILNRPLRTDTRVEEELYIYNGRPEA